MQTCGSWAGQYLNPSHWFGDWKQCLTSGINNLFWYLSHNSWYILSYTSRSRPIQLSTARVIKYSLTIIASHWLIIVWTDVLRGANWSFPDLSEELKVVIVFAFLPNTISVLHRSLTDRQMNREPVKNAVTAEHTLHCTWWSVKPHDYYYFILYLSVSHMSESQKHLQFMRQERPLLCKSINQSIGNCLWNVKNKADAP